MSVIAIDASQEEHRKSRKPKRAKREQGGAEQETSNDPTTGLSHAAHAKKKERKRKRALGKDEEGKTELTVSVAHPVGIVEERTGKEKSKKTKKLSHTEDELASEFQAEAAETKVKPKKSKRSRKADHPDDEAHPVHTESPTVAIAHSPLPEFPRKKHRTSTYSDVVEKEDKPSSKAEKEKKRKRKERQEDEQEQVAPPKPKKRKSRKPQHDLPDPSEDETLTDQARKALHYAYLQFIDPGSWKFNKARQNWLVRNLWSADAIPETYIPLLNRYLAGVQGGVREMLVKTCQEVLADQAPTAEDAQVTSDSEPKTRSTPVADAVKIKQGRAAALLVVLPTESSS